MLVRRCIYIETIPCISSFDINSRLTTNVDRLCVIYAREDNDFNGLVIITWLVWTIWTSMSAVLKKAVKLNHSLTTVDDIPSF